MPDRKSAPAKPIDTLTSFARLLAAIEGELNTYQLEKLTQDTGLELEQMHELFECAKIITAVANEAPGPQAGTSTLERKLEEVDIYDLTGERAVWIGIEDPKRPGRGFDIRINDAGDGPVIDVWMMNDMDIPGVDGPEGAPLAPIASYGFAYTDHLNPDLDEELGHA